MYDFDIILANMLRTLIRYSKVIARPKVLSHTSSTAFPLKPIPHSLPSLQSLEVFLSKSISPQSPLPEATAPDACSLHQEISSLTYSDLLDHSVVLSKTNIYSKTHEEILKLLWARFSEIIDSQPLSVQEIQKIAANLLKHRPRTSIIDDILEKLLGKRYLNMEDMTILVDLTFVQNKSSNIKLLKKTIQILYERISHNYNVNHLLSCAELCGNMEEMSEEAIRASSKLNNLFQNKVDMRSYNDYIMVLDVYGRCRHIHKSLITLAFKNISEMASKQELTMATVIQTLNKMSELAQSNAFYATYTIRKSLIVHFMEHITYEDLNDENYGKLLQNLLLLRARIPNEIIDLFLKRFQESKKVNLNFVQAFLALSSLGVIKNAPVLSETSIGSLSQISVEEVIRIIDLICVENTKKNDFLRIILDEARKG